MAERSILSFLNKLYGFTLRYAPQNDVRGVRVDDDGYLETSIVSTGGLTVVPFAPYPGGGGSVAIGAASSITGAMTVGKPYWLWTTANCWMRYGNAAAVAVAGSDLPFPANVVAEYTPETSQNYIAVIQMSAGGVLYYGRSAI